MPDSSDEEIENLEITDDVYSTRCTCEEIMKNHEAKAIFKKYFGNIDEHPSFAMTMGMTIDKIASYSKDVHNEKVMYMLNKELTKIKKY